ncbi:MAG: DUF1559 domain-containing protein, partial [Planctomycetaceae bacterium]|nr:DUF1559 domain-containing protein [Planctomycetaceae bacterium]
NCPSRRSGLFEKTAFSMQNPLLYLNAIPQNQESRTDYVVNAGSRDIDWGTGPVTMAQGIYEIDNGPTTYGNGISHQRSEIALSAITDGLSFTYLAGEKYLKADVYYTGQSLVDDHSMFAADALDTHASTSNPPLQDDKSIDDYHRFGSAHIDGCNMLLCDGSVRMISYAIDLGTHQALSTRAGQERVGEY